jgi:magnesium-transporting ATPase (P-type)
MSGLGLNSQMENIERRIQKYGSNHIKQKPIKNFLLFVWEAWWDVTLVILTIAAVVSLLLSFYRPNSSNSQEEDDVGELHSMQVYCLHNSSSFSYVKGVAYSFEACTSDI